MHAAGEPASTIVVTLNTSRATCSGSSQKRTNGNWRG
ncbi:MAG TPA: hypothetical protein VE197_21840 [Mycobacterium sp.]|nr:hypothetical protein [Mycobacterium sp.]